MLQVTNHTQLYKAEKSTTICNTIPAINSQETLRAEVQVINSGDKLFPPGEITAIIRSDRLCATVIKTPLKCGDNILSTKA